MTAGKYRTRQRRPEKDRSGNRGLLLLAAGAVVVLLLTGGRIWYLSSCSGRSHVSTTPIPPRAKFVEATAPTDVDSRAAKTSPSRQRQKGEQISRESAPLSPEETKALLDDILLRYQWFGAGDEGFFSRITPTKDRVFFFAGAYHRWRCVSRDTGGHIWETQAGSGVEIPFTDGTDLFLYSAADGTLSFLDGKAGKSKRHARLPLGLLEFHLLDNGRLLAVGETKGAVQPSRALYLIDLPNEAAIVWSLAGVQAVTAHSEEVACVTLAGLQGQKSVCAAAGVAIRTGEILWHTAPRTDAAAFLAVTHDACFHLSDGVSLSCVAQDDGRVMALFANPGEPPGGYRITALCATPTGDVFVSLWQGPSGASIVRWNPETSKVAEVCRTAFPVSGMAAGESFLVAMGADNWAGYDWHTKKALWDKRRSEDGVGPVSEVCAGSVFWCVTQRPGHEGELVQFDLNSGKETKLLGGFYDVRY